MGEMSVEQGDATAVIPQVRLDQGEQEPLPRISIVTPSFNQGAYLERTIQSLLHQDYPDIEHLVIDGGSTDGSLDLLKKYERHMAYWESQPDRGQSHAINKGFARATGEIMGWLNSDDILLPHALKIVGQVFHDHPQIQWLTAGSMNITADDRLFSVRPSRRFYSRWTQLFNYSPPPQHCTFWRRDLWVRSGGYLREDTRVMDCELWLRFYEHAQLYVVDTMFGAWRCHPEAYTVRNAHSLLQEVRVTQAPHLRRYLRQRPWLFPLVPVFRMALRIVTSEAAKPMSRDLVNRVFFDWRVKPTRFLTFDPQAGRFRLRT